MVNKFAETEHNQIASQFKELVRSGRTGQEIMTQLGITPKRAKSLHYDLLRAGEITPTGRLDFTCLGEAEVARKGNVFITSQRLDALGLGEVFRPGTRLKVERDGNALRIEVLSTSNRGAAAEEPPSSRWGGWFKRTSRQRNS